MRYSFVISTVLLLAATWNVDGAVVIFNDTFENGANVGETATRLDDAFDPLDANWWKGNGIDSPATSVSVTNVSGSNRLTYNNAGQTFRRIATSFTRNTLAVGDTMTLTMKIAITSTVPTNSAGLRFGLYSDGSTPSVVTGDFQESSQLNDAGYYVRVPTGTAANADIFDEPAGDNPLGGTPGGATIATTTGSTSINDANPHTLVLSLTLTSASQLDLTFTIDGVTKVIARDTTSIVSSFDHIYIGEGGVSYTFTMDDAKLEVSSIPEPGMAGAGMMMALAGLRRRRVKRAA